MDKSNNVIAFMKPVSAICAGFRLTQKQMLTTNFLLGHAQAVLIDDPSVTEFEYVCRELRAHVALKNMTDALFFEDIIEPIRQEDIYWGGLGVSSWGGVDFQTGYRSTGFLADVALLKNGAVKYTLPDSMRDMLLDPSQCAYVVVGLCVTGIGSMSLRFYDLLASTKEFKTLECGKKTIITIKRDMLIKMAGEGYKGNLRNRVINPAIKQIARLKHMQISEDYREVRRGKMIDSYSFVVTRTHNHLMLLDHIEMGQEENALDPAQESLKGRIDQCLSRVGMWPNFRSMIVDQPHILKMGVKGVEEYIIYAKDAAKGANFQGLLRDALIEQYDLTLWRKARDQRQQEFNLNVKPFADHIESMKQLFLDMPPDRQTMVLTDFKDDNVTDAGIGVDIDKYRATGNLSNDVLHKLAYWMTKQKEFHP